MSDSKRREFWNRALRRRIADEAATSKEWPADGKIRPDTWSEWIERCDAAAKSPAFMKAKKKNQIIYPFRRTDSAE